MASVVVTGASGFIGGHLCKRLVAEGHRVIGVDWEEPRYMTFEEMGLEPKHQFILADLRSPYQAVEAMRIAEPQWVFALAADMGGMGFISNNDYRILQNNLRINMHTLAAARAHDIEKYFFSSSVCVYPEHKQMHSDWVRNMLESDAWPAQPQDAYGWEKLTAEELLRTVRNDHRFPTYVARFHNCYGPYGAWKGGREKAPAALSRKVAEAKHFQERPATIEVWGDGKQVRPFIYIDDLLDGILQLIQTDYHFPVNLGPTWSGDGSGKFIMEIDYLVDTIADIAGLGASDYQIKHVPGPEGVRYRGADGSLMKRLTGWEPKVGIREGIQHTYHWIERQVTANVT